MSTIIPKMHFINTDGSKLTVDAPIGMSVLKIAQNNGIEIPGVCGGVLACSTCHVIVAPEYFKKLPPTSVEEEDMLDLTYGVERTSRLCCQIIITKELDGITVRIPQATVNLV